VVIADAIRAVYCGGGGHLAVRRPEILPRTVCHVNGGGE
jgi:hypothetical protein